MVVPVVNVRVMLVRVSYRLVNMCVPMTSARRKKRAGVLVVMMLIVGMPMIVRERLM